VALRRQYFNGDEPWKLPFVTGHRIVNRVDWMWMETGDTRCPRVGARNWLRSVGLDNYSEAMLLYVWAWWGGSPLEDHPGNSGPMAISGRPTAAIVMWPLLRFGGISMQQCWIVCVPRDGYMNGQGLTYFENSRRASLAQRAYSIETRTALAATPVVLGVTWSAVRAPNGHSVARAPPP